MEFIPKKLKGVYEIQLSPKEDNRGFFMRTYDDNIFKEANLPQNWVQENHSLSIKKGTIRGLHFQFPPNTETKFVRLVSGRLLDVYVDLRKDSPTFGQWGSTELSAEKKNALIIPKGFAHGICTLTDNCEMLYKVDAHYAPNNEYNIIWNDPEIGIEWPISYPTEISERDKNATSFNEFKTKFGYLEI